MPLTYTAPPQLILGTIASSDIVSATFDLKSGIATLIANHLDAAGNVITTESIQFAVPAGVLATVKTAVYTKLQAVRGAGPVT